MISHRFSLSSSNILKRSPHWSSFGFGAKRASKNNTSFGDRSSLLEECALPLGGCRSILVAVKRDGSERYQVKGTSKIFASIFSAANDT